MIRKKTLYDSIINVFVTHAHCLDKGIKELGKNTPDHRVVKYDYVYGKHFADNGSAEDARYFRDFVYNLIGLDEFKSLIEVLPLDADEPPSQS